MILTGRGAAIGLCTAWLASSAPASAQEPPIFVDPDSPAGTEYRLPLETVRREAAGDAGTATGGRGPAGQPLFGVGIREAGEAGDSGRTDPGERRAPRGASPEGESSAEGPDAAHADSVSESGGTGARSTAGVEAAAGDGSTGLITGAIAAGVLALGLVIGVALRRVLRSD
jgi:hypothetical protein